MAKVIYRKSDGSIVAIHHQTTGNPQPLDGQRLIEAELPDDASPTDYDVVDGVVNDKS